MRPLVAVLLVGFMLWTIPARAQLLVFDEQNFVPNMATLAETIVLAANSILDLTEMAKSAMDDIDAIVNEVNGLIHETQALMWDIRVIEAKSKDLFGLKGAPTSYGGQDGLMVRLQVIREYKSEILLKARTLQTIMKAAEDAFRRILNIIDKIAGLAGNKAAQANMQEQLALILKSQQEHGVAMAAYQQAMLTDKQEEPFIQESVEKINDALLKDWPR